MKLLPMNFYTMPKFANMTIDKKDLKELLLNTGSDIIACGSLWDIVTKHLGAGVYKVSLKLKKIDSL